jgi:acylphosphatase
VSNVPEVIAKRFVVSGRVQGVGFRVGTVEAAKARRLAGWVRNVPDGRVEIHAQGSIARIADFARWVESGPRWARVEGVESRDVPVESALEGFEIRG